MKALFKKRWSQIKWFIKEIGKLYSNQESYFSKKRVESGIAFFVFIWGAIFFLIKKYSVMSTSDFVLWATPVCLVSGYIISQIQSERKFDILNPKEPENLSVKTTETQISETITKTE
mgnify:CR=1 FL=1